MTCETLNAKDLLDLNLVHGLAEIEEEQIATLNHFTHSEEMFPTFQECYKNTHEFVLSKRRDEENSIAEFLERSERENPRKVVLDLFYKKQLLEHADLSARSKYSDRFESKTAFDFDQKLVENNHLNYEVFLGEHIKTIDPSQFPNSEFMKHLPLI